MAGLLERFDLTDAAEPTCRPTPAACAARLDLAMTLVGSPAVDLPRRADHRARPAQPPHHVADHSRARRRRRHDLPHHPVPRRSRRARRPGSRSSITVESSPKERRPSSSAASPADTSELQFAEPDRAARCGRRTPDATPDDDQLILQVPGDGSVASLRHVLDELRRRPHRRRQPVRSTPRPRRRVLRRHRATHYRKRRPRAGGTSVMSTLAYTLDRLGNDAAPQPANTSAATRR